MLTTLDIFHFGRRWTPLFCLVLVVVGRIGVAEPIDYNFDIKPILSDRCYKCHGPDARQRQAKLRLDVARGDENPLDRGVIVPGDPEASSLFQRITSHDPDERMPPTESKLPPISPDEIERIRQWIVSGATWKSHWSFIPLATVSLPDVKDFTWVHNPIDRFVLSKLERLNISPSPKADRETLIRRVTFDLTGLPPTSEEIDAYLNDSLPNAFERVVDRLLKSEHYGERLAVHWLDAARYADSYGYQVDRDRRVWPWRDWVIRAFNDNQPYNEFITWQLAGDLLPAATEQQILATTFHRLHPQKTEGGSIEEEFRVEYVADRTHTFGTVMLGLTLECARCHDHKYDSVAQREYYRLFAFFNNIDESGLYAYSTSETSIPTPTLLLPNSEKKSQLAELTSSLATAEAELTAIISNRREEFEQWLTQRPASEDVLIPGGVAHIQFEEHQEGKYLNSLDTELPAETSPANERVMGRNGYAIRLTGDDEIRVKTKESTRNDPFSISLWIKADQLKDRIVLFHRSAGWTDTGSRGYQLLLEKGCLSASLIHFWPGDAIRVRSRQAIEHGVWIHIAVTYDGSSRAAGLQIYRDGKREDCEVVRDHLLKTIIDKKDHIAIGARNRDFGFTKGLVDDLQIFERELTALEVAHLFDGNSLSSVLAKPSEELLENERDQLFEYYLSTIDISVQSHLQQLHNLRQQRGKLVDSIPEIMVMRDMEKVRPTFVLERGRYDARGERVEPLTPEVLLDFPSDEPRNRLGLAAWLTERQHPLTARVAVNRLWQVLFGEGLVRTPEDFGSQGELPTHPQLLDWLAIDFIDNGWNVKRLLKQLVMSSTYRQSSQPRIDLEARDPENRWLARGGRHRLTAEMIRDTALSVSGLLVERVGGPPTLPYEVAASFRPTDHEKGEGLYRRSLYTKWRRTGPPPMMMAFDAAKRDVCVVKRERTSTPLQALVLLNAPQMVEAARVFGEKLVIKYQWDTGAIVNEMFRTLTGRRASPEEQQVLLAMYQKQLQQFRENPLQAKEFLATGEAPRDDKLDVVQVATTGALAGALMNFDGCLMKR